MVFCKQLFKILAVLLVFCLLASSLSACKKTPSALDAMNEFMSAYGIDKTVYSKSLREGDEGYADSEFFYNTYGEGEECVLDYAVMFLSVSDTVGECAVFICYTDYDAILVTDMCRRRISLFHTLAGSVDITYLSDAFIKRYGRVVVMCALADNERAEQIFDRIF